MVEAYARDCDRLDRTAGRRCIPSAAHAALENRDIDAGFREGNEGSDGKKIELRDIEGRKAFCRTCGKDPSACLVCCGNRMGKRLFRDGLAAYLHALVVAHKLRRRIEAAAETFCHKEPCRIACRRGLAIRAGNLDGTICLVRIMELFEHRRDRIQARRDAETERPLQGCKRLIICRVLHSEGKRISH